MSTKTVTGTTADVTFGVHGVPGTEPEAAVVLLHGGVGRPRSVPAWLDPAFLRMVPFVPPLLRGGRGRLLVVPTHHTRHGWLRQIGDDWDWSDITPGGALATLVEAVRATVGEDLPIHLVGHSSGGWAAIHAARNHDIASVLALAPWVEKDESPEGLGGTRVVVAHGSKDTITSPVDSAHFVDRLRATGGDARFIDVPGEHHAMLRHPLVWQRIAADFARAAVTDLR